MQWEHNGHTITLTDDKRFIISGGLFDGDADHQRIFDSYTDATHKIDERAALEAKKNRQSNRLTLPALDSSGRPIIITGIHIKRGTLLGFENDGADIYPAVPWLHELLVEQRACRNRIEQIGRLTYKFRISGRRGYPKPEDYDGDIAKLVEEHRTQTEAAEAHRPVAE